MVEGENLLHHVNREGKLSGELSGGTGGHIPGNMSGGICPEEYVQGNVRIPSIVWRVSSEHGQIARTLLSKDVCLSVRLSVHPSVCLSHAGIILKWLKKLFSYSCSHTILVFSYQSLWQYFDRDLLTRALNADGYEKS